MGHVVTSDLMLQESQTHNGNADYKERSPLFPEQASL